MISSAILLESCVISRLVLEKTRSHSEDIAGTESRSNAYGRKVVGLYPRLVCLIRKGQQADRPASPSAGLSACTGTTRPAGLLQSLRQTLRLQLEECFWLYTAINARHYRSQSKCQRRHCNALTHNDTERVVASSDFPQARKWDVFRGRIQSATCSAMVSY